MEDDWIIDEENSLEISGLTLEPTNAMLCWGVEDTICEDLYAVWTKILAETELLYTLWVQDCEINKDLIVKDGLYASPTKYIKFKTSDILGEINIIRHLHAQPVGTWTHNELNDLRQALRTTLNRLLPNINIRTFSLLDD